MTLFDKLNDASGSVDSLDRFLNENIGLLNEIYDADCQSLLPLKNSIETFILLKFCIYSHLDYTKGYNQAFALMLLDFCERFNLLSATPRVYEILVSNNIPINSRLQATLYFLYPKPETNSALVERFDHICEKLHFAIQYEEDNEKRVIAAFLNYYGYVVNNSGTEYAEQVKAKAFLAIENRSYHFLLSEAITEALNIGLQKPETAYNEIQNLIDKILERKEIETYIPVTEELLIEEETEYSKEIEIVPAQFDAIRKISVRKAKGIGDIHRGVKILETEAELFDYMKRFGNMHKAKLQSAMAEPFPQSFTSKVDVIDWGCGQGIATMVLLEKYGCQYINGITLIEPSELSLKRAVLHCKKYCSGILLNTVFKKLDDLDAEDFSHFSRSGITVHLFSNILDIDAYFQNRLLELMGKILTGQNYFVCVSPCIDVIKTERLESFRRYFETRYNSFELLADLINSKSADDIFWNCNNTYKKNQCSRHTVYGCEGKWTRVIKCFKIQVET